VTEPEDPFAEIVTLAEAGALLGLSGDTLRVQVHRGRFRARLIGKTYVTTRAEVERYRAESLGRAGRPFASEPSRSGRTKWSVVKAERQARKNPPGS
jgi:hypothetical protein